MAAALTDGGGNYVIGGDSPVLPSPTAPVASTSVQAPAASPLPVPKPVSTVSSKTAAAMVNDKIVPAMNNASDDVANQNAARSASLAAGYVYNVPDGKGGFYSGPSAGAPKPETSTSTSTTPTPTPEETIANTPPDNSTWIYNTTTGERASLANGTTMPTGYTANNPKASPAAPTQGITDQTTDPVGNTYKQFADGTYGKFDATGTYVGPTTQQDFQTNKAGQSILTSLNQVINGTYPLTADQQAQIAGLTSAFQSLITQQTTANANLTGGTTVAANLYGMGNSVTGLGMIKGTVDTGIAKIADLNNKMVSAVAQMRSAFQQDNMTMLKTAYDLYSTNAKDRQTEIDRLHKVATDAKLAAQDEADKQRVYDLDVQKFKQTGDQNAFKNALDKEQEAEAERHNKETEAIDRFKAGEGAGGGDGPSGVTSSAIMGADGKPDSQSQQAVMDQITAKYGPMTAVAIKGLADYSINPVDWRPGASKGMTRDQAVTLAKMYDPTYSDAQFPVRQAFLKSLASNTTGTIGSAINAANKSVNHLTAFANTMSKLGSTPSKTLNFVLLNTVGQLGGAERQKLSAAKVEGMGVADELAKFFKGVGVTDTKSVEDWKNQLSTNASPSDVHGLVQGAVTLLAGQLETLSEQYDNTMGHPPANTFLGTSALANLSQLKNEGYTVDIPGVYYTDKNAYLRNTPDGASALKTAATQLQQLGIPTTPENILQAAQVTQ